MLKDYYAEWVLILKMGKKKGVKIEKVANDIIKLSRDLLIVNMRFLDVAICRLTLKNYSGSFCVDGMNMYYDPEYLVLQYKDILLRKALEYMDQ